MLESLKKLWHILTPMEKRKALLVFILVLVMAGMETAGVVSIMPFLAVLARPDVIHDNAILAYIYNFFSFNNKQSFILVLGIFSIFIVLFSSLFKSITIHTLNRFANLQRYYFSFRLLSVYLQQPYIFFLQRNSAELNQNILSEVDHLLGNVLQPLLQMLSQGFIVLAMLALLFIYNPVMAFSLMLIVGSLYGLIYWLVRKHLTKIGLELHTANKERFIACQEALSGIKDVKITHSASAYMERFNRSSRIFARHLAANETLSQVPLFLVEATGYTGLILLALLLIHQSNDIAHILPVLGLYGFAAYRILPAAQIIYRAFARMRFAGATLQNIHRDLSLPLLAKINQMAPLIPQRDIQLMDVSYAYPGSQHKEILQHVNLTIPVNSSLGIVGKSGSGKSTLMDILLGLLTPQLGQLLIDDVPITADNVTGWQQSIGYVPQHIYLADASVAANIAFGVPQENIDMDAVVRTAKAAQIHDFIISELHQGYYTTVGERGVLLSGGQRQRIGIARALYRDPPVLLMDEATSALDAETEAAVNAAINELNGKKTLIIIAHRESAVAGCNKILSLG
ncbi:ABC transporter ATP-binding protein [Alkanindiges illinoisensis]|uniref:ABC transporter ATP-binding protein n=1 Tax=Alkanindiges illinoisensis TaxID=197183 RepID=UPI00047A110A|nr:ABC transporter ATP-binding protein [Alkanindiges illinoisensis]